THAFGNLQTPGENRPGTAKEAALGTGSQSAPPRKAPLVCCADGLDKDTFKICKQFLRPVKSSLGKLNLSQYRLRQKKLKCVQRSLAILGNRIDLFLHKFCRASEVTRWRKKLWLFVSLFSQLEADQLEMMYVYIKENQMDEFLVSFAFSLQGNRTMSLFLRLCKDIPTLRKSKLSERKSAKQMPVAGTRHTRLIGRY
uniref:Chromosome 17 open reading frame 64 n=1 Tax=Amazona collaria TaxID=241587 RepID=A0A8B9FB56_9PSIT